MDTNRTPNQLIYESSPYLLQHAYNPVNWYPWGDAALKAAQEQDKPILVSIGYSSCHWCHVMEREVFENDEIAGMMNNHFINIKVDREERPDVDAVYMDALQNMNIQGGWPLNIFLTPTAEPFYGATYVPPTHWTNLLNQISKGFKEHRADIEKSAADFTRVLNYTEVFKYELTDTTKDFKKEDLDLIYNSLEKKFDNKFGGKQNAPKFPMPSIYLFLLRYYHISKHESALRHLKLTLDKMAMGGIYDQIGGGFARYSVDEKWFAPHFEKMLYDNGQLVSLYSEAYSLTKSTLYKDIVYNTIDFVKRELFSSEGGIFSALDADSEGIEGKFYIWTFEELKSLPINDLHLLFDYYGIVEGGNWEHDFNILHRNLSDYAFCNKHQLTQEQLSLKLKNWKSILMEHRVKRIRPGLDDKILTSWNALMLKGIIDAYRAFNEASFLQLAIANAQFIKSKLTNEHQLYHSYKNGKASINGFLEDYAFVIQAYIALYQATFDESWLKESKELTDFAVTHFWDSNEELFYFTSSSGEKLIARKKEIFDNVIPASNSVMAQNLFLLGNYFAHTNYVTKAESMMAKIKKLLIAEPSYLSNWACLYFNFAIPFAEVVISGKDFLNYRQELDKHYNPNLLVAGTNFSSQLPLLEGRDAKPNETNIYVCYNRTCKLPVSTPKEALEIIKQ